MRVVIPAHLPKLFFSKYKVLIRFASNVSMNADCKICSTTFKVSRTNKKYCSDECRHAAMQRADQKYKQKKKQGSFIKQLFVLTIASF